MVLWLLMNAIMIMKEHFLSFAVSIHAYLSCAFFFFFLIIITHCCFLVLNNTSLFNTKLTLSQILVLTFVSTLTPVGANNKLRTDNGLFPSPLKWQYLMLQLTLFIEHSIRYFADIVVLKCWTSICSYTFFPVQWHLRIMDFDYNCSFP